MSLSDLTTHPAQLESCPAWPKLQAAARVLRDSPLRALFATDPQRAERFSARHDALLLDFSKQCIDDSTFAALCELAEQCGLRQGIAALFAGDLLNNTERRAALHMAMRNGAALPSDGAAAVRDNLERVDAFADAVRTGQLRGATGETIDTVVNIGIGGSDLGPRMAVEALTGLQASPVALHFVANIDPDDLDQTLAGLNPARTLFIVSSKSFSTLETLTNASRAKAWLHAELGEQADIGRHFAAVSNAGHSATAFGLPAERVFSLPEWVGGRYSVWSAIGLPLRIALGKEQHAAFLAGARNIDEHFRSAPFAANLPVLLALLSIWNTALLDIPSLAVLPYAHRLRRLPDYLQQLEMESNGKRVRRDGSPVGCATSPVLWGGVGTLGQHAFHQLLYQGTQRVALDFIVPIGPDSPARRALVSNALGQAAALMLGRTQDQAAALLRARGTSEAETARLAPHLVCPGNQPSNTLLLPQLDPYTLGQLLALYEHKVFAAGWMLGINSFDQYGVELGKEMARALDGDAPDTSTAALLKVAQAHWHK